MKTWRSDDGEASDFSSIDPPPPPPEIDPAIDTVGSSCAESTWLGEKQAERDAEYEERMEEEYAKREGGA
jgi:hypothetical protein